MAIPIESYMNLPYTIRLKPQPDGDWLAEIEELPGCIAVGETQTEALAVLEGAKELWLTVSLENGDNIPEPSST